MKKVNSAIAAGCVFLAFTIITGGQALAQPRPPEVLTVPVDIAKMFVASGFMGDGEKGGNVKVMPVAENLRPGHTEGLCIRVSYKPGGVGWAGVYWQYPAQNWGDTHGRSIRNATKVVFWAAGQKGGEIVEFKAGGIAAAGKKFKDSFEVTMGSTALAKEWKRYEISVKGMDLSDVIGAFAWVATVDANPGGVVFYLDDMRYE